MSHEKPGNVGESKVLKALRHKVMVALLTDPRSEADLGNTHYPGQEELPSSARATRHLWVDRGANLHTSIRMDSLLGSSSALRDPALHVTDKRGLEEGTVITFAGSEVYGHIVPDPNTGESTRFLDLGTTEGIEELRAEVDRILVGLEDSRY